MRTTLAWGLAVLLAAACSGDGDDLTGALGGELTAAADIGTGRRSRLT